MAQNLASLVVKLEAETSRYSKELEKAKRQLSVFDKSARDSVARVAKAAGTAALAAAVGFAVLTKQSINSADKLSKLSQSLGISTEALSQLNYAAGLSGTSSEELSKSLARLSRNATDAARGLSAPKRVFDALGVSVKNADGSLKGSEQLLLDIADKFSQYEDGAGKAAIAQELFGRAGAKMIPLLNQGRDGIEKLKKEADALGLTLSTKAGKEAEEFNDNITRLKSAFSGIINQVAQRLLPSLVALSEKFVDGATSGDKLQGTVDSLVTGVKLLASAFVVIKATLQAVGNGIGALGAASDALGLSFASFASPLTMARDIIKGVATDSGGAARAVNILKEGFGDIKENASRDLKVLESLWSDTDDTLQEVRITVKKLKEEFVFQDEAAAKAAAKAVEELAKKQADALASVQGLSLGLKQQIETYGVGAAAAMRYRIEHGDLAETFATAGAAAQPYKQELIDMTGRMEDLEKATKAQAEAEQERQEMFSRGQSLTEALRTPLEQYSATLKEINTLLQEGAISYETYGRALEKAQEDLDAATNKWTVFKEQAARNSQDIIADTLVNGFDNGVKGILKSFGQMIVQLTAQAVAADLAGKLFGTAGGGTGGGWVGAAMSIFGAIAGKANGGPVSANTPYVVGERGPEMFVPNSSGKIIPNHEMKGGGMTVNFALPPGANPASMETQTQIMNRMAATLAAARRRNG